MKIGFDHQRYIEEQSKYILERVETYDKLYLEFGGKLMLDLHAKRCLPGFDENAKIKLLQKLKDQLEIVICVYSQDIERSRIRGDFGITYGQEVMRMIDDFRTYQLDVNSVVITRYTDHPVTQTFINRLERRGIKVYRHKATKGYPTELDVIVSDEGYGQNPYIKTTKKIVVLTAPGPNSGKLATCLSQLYHEFRQGQDAGYSKFETFPVWNMPLKHPLNVAYEAATVDLKDINMIDSFHAEAYNQIAVNYNRDIETFPVLRRIIEKITGKKSTYQSPTDMGVNRVLCGITDDEAVREASCQEVIRRYFTTLCDYKKGLIEEDTLERMVLILEGLNLKPEDRKVVLPAREKASLLKQDPMEEETPSVMAIELDDGKILTGKASVLMSAPAAALLNAVKYLANISDDILLLSPVILEPIKRLKSSMNPSSSPSLTTEEILIALSISAATNPIAQVALQKLHLLKNCQAHCTVILDSVNEQIFRQLGVDVTCDDQFATSNLFY